jgi:hypothetical protein
MNAASAASLIATTSERRFSFLGVRKAAGATVIGARERQHNAKEFASSKRHAMTPR